MNNLTKLKFTPLFLFAALLLVSCSQQDKLDKIATTLADREHTFDVLEKRIDDILWYDRVGDVAMIDKVRLAGPPLAVQTPTGTPFLDALLDNDLKFYAYIFFPRETHDRLA